MYLPRIGSAELENHSLIPKQLKDKIIDRKIQRTGILSQLRELEKDLLLDGYEPRTRHSKLVLYDINSKAEDQPKVDVTKNLEVLQMMQNKVQNTIRRPTQQKKLMKKNFVSAKKISSIKHAKNLEEIKEQYNQRVFHRANYASGYENKKINQ